MIASHWMSTTEEAQPKQPAAIAPDLIAAEPGRFRCAIWHNISFLVWSGQATLHAVKQLKRVTQVLIGRYPRATRT
jgi:hypothetical protein